MFNLILKDVVNTTNLPTKRTSHEKRGLDIAVMIPPRSPITWLQKKSNPSINNNLNLIIYRKKVEASS